MFKNSQKVNLKDVSEITMGQSPDSITYNTEKDGLPFFQGKTEFKEKYIGTPSVWCNAPKKIANSNGILMSVRAPVGDVNITLEKCCIGRGLASIRAKNISTEYLFFALSLLKDEIESKGVGSTFKAINKDIIESIQIPSVDKKLQNDFSEFFIQIDKSKFLLQQMIEKLELLKKSRFIEMFGCIGKDEKQWGLKSLKDCVEVNPQKSKDPLILSNSIEEVSFVPMAFVGENGSIDCSCIKNYDEVKSGFTYFKENDVLFAKITPCMENGKGCIAKGLHNGIGFGSTEFHVLRPLDNLCNPKWLYYVSTSQEMRRSAEKKMTGSAGQRRVPAKFLEDFKISIPPIELQKQFATFVSQVDKSKAILQKQLDDLVGSNKY